MRDFIITQALKSFRSLSNVIGEITEDEALHVLQVESGSRRRLVMIDKLILKAAELNRIKYIETLKEKFRGTIKSNHP